MLTALDESFLHQMPATFAAVATSDHRFYDRCFVSCAHPAGEIVISMGMAVYKNMNVADGFAILSSNGEQHNVRVSRELLPNAGEHAIGPLRYDVIEPLKALRISLAPGSYPFAFDLIWRGEIAPFLEQETVNYVNGRLATHVQRYDQAGSVSGWVQLNGAHFAFGDWHGTRDHSWGVRRDVGGFEPFNGPHVNQEQGFLIVWCVFQAGDCAGYLQVHEDGEGNITKMDGMLRWHPQLQRADARVVSFTDHVDFYPGERRYRRAYFTLRTDDGRQWEFKAEPLAPATVVHGGGYERGFNDGKGLGLYRGEYLIETDTYAINQEPDIVKVETGERIASLQREQIVKVELNGVHGFGDLTILPYGAIPRYGLTGLTATEQQVVQKNQI